MSHDDEWIVVGGGGRAKAPKFRSKAHHADNASSPNAVGAVQPMSQQHHSDRRGVPDEVVPGWGHASAEATGTSGRCEGHAGGSRRQKMLSGWQAADCQARGRRMGSILLTCCAQGAVLPEPPRARETQGPEPRREGGSAVVTSESDSSELHHSHLVVV